MATRVEVDFNAITNAINAYTRAISDFESIVNTLDAPMCTLEASGWKSAASEAFFRRYEDRWKANMDTHKSSIGTLRESLQCVCNQYNDLYDTIPQMNASLSR